MIEAPNVNRYQRKAVSPLEEKILVVLPSLGERIGFLQETLRSIDNQRADVDLTIVAALPVGATHARALCRAYGAQVVDDPRMGISAAINLAIDQAQDESLYAWIGDDDLFLSGALVHLRSLLKRRPNAAVAYGACHYIDEEGRLLLTNHFGRLARALLPIGPNLIPHPGSMMRIDAMRRVGLYDTELKYAMDLDLFLRLRSEGRFVSSQQPVSAFRWHAESLTSANKRASNAEADDVRKAYLSPAVRPICELWHAPIRHLTERKARAMSSARRGRPIPSSSDS